jgi:hypothetical protein
MVNGDKFGAVGEGRLDLHVVNHFGHALITSSRLRSVVP